MPHIHTEPGQIDFIAEVFIVYKNKVLIRLHDKHKIWIAPGGHVELNETPGEAAIREAKEEVGLDIQLWEGNKFDAHLEGLTVDNLLTPPFFMNIHEVKDTPGHRHLVCVYFATSKTDEAQDPSGEERSGGFRWMTREDLLVATDMRENVKNYALKALDILGMTNE